MWGSSKVRRAATKVPSLPWHRDSLCPPSEATKNAPVWLRVVLWLVFLRIREFRQAQRRMLGLAALYTLDFTVSATYRRPSPEPIPFGRPVVFADRLKILLTVLENSFGL